MGIFDIFKGKETLTGTDIVALEEQYDKAQKEQEKEKNFLQEELNKQRALLEETRKKYEEERKAMTEFKTQKEQEKEKQEKEKILIDTLKSEGANPQIIKLLKKEFDINALEIENGKFSNWETISTPIKKEYGDFFEQPKEQGIDVVNPINQDVNPEVDEFAEGFKSDGFTNQTYNKQ